jgi:hypothetical protein
MRNDPTNWAKEFDDFMAAYNTTLKQDGLPLSEWQSINTGDQSDIAAPRFISTLTHAPRGEPLETERSQEGIRDIDL